MKKDSITNTHFYEEFLNKHCDTWSNGWEINFKQVFSDMIALGTLSTEWHLY